MATGPLSLPSAGTPSPRRRAAAPTRSRAATPGDGAHCLRHPRAGWRRRHRARERAAGREPGDPAGGGRTAGPEQPLFSLGAMTQGEIGSLIASPCTPCADAGAGGRLGHPRHRVDPTIPRSPGRPSRSVRSSPSRQADRLAETRGWDVTTIRPGLPPGGASPSRGRRERRDRVASSIGPDRRRPAAAAAIPVGRQDGVWDGVDAVIDKDYVAAELGHLARGRGAGPDHGGRAGADRLRKAQPAAATWTDTCRAERHIAAGQFPAGSMGPEGQAAASSSRREGAPP